MSHRTRVTRSFDRSRNLNKNLLHKRGLLKHAAQNKTSQVHSAAAVTHSGRNEPAQKKDITQLQQGPWDMSYT
jgi:hypothetical protein